MKFLAAPVFLVTVCIATPTQARVDQGRGSSRPDRERGGRRCVTGQPLPRTEQFEKRGHAVPPSLSETTHGPWHEMSNGLSIAATFPPKRQMTEETIHMKAIVVTDQAAGTAGMKLVERPEPPAAINDVIVQIHASGFVPTELAWPSTWTDRRDRDRTPSIPGHELAGVVTALGYGTTGLSVGQRVFGLADWHRDGTLAEYVAIEARNLAPLPGDVDFTVGASLPISGLTAWQGLFQHGRLQAGKSVLAHGAAGAVGSMVTQLAREAGGYVIGTGRAADRQKALDFGAQEFVDLDNDALEDVGGVDLVFDVIGGDIQKRSAGLIRAGGTLVSIVGPTEARPADGLAVDFVVESDRAQLSEIVQRVRDGRLRTNIGNVSALDDAVATFNATERRAGKTVIRVRP
jgi:NADPH:quinone reductase-like Zn-dependent oxidoreductase